MEQDSSGGGGAEIAEKVLTIMETILQEASTMKEQPTVPSSKGDQTELDMLLDRITSPFVVRKLSLC